MKRTVILSMISIVIIGIVVGFNVFTHDSDTELYLDDTHEVGYRLKLMEEESDSQVKNIIEQIRNGYASEEDCREEIGSMVRNILFNLSQLEKKEGNHINVAYNANVIRKLSRLDQSKEKYTPEESRLRKDELAVFCHKLHSYYIEMIANDAEKADYIALVKRARRIKKGFDPIVDAYVEKVFACYNQ